MRVVPPLNSIYSSCPHHKQRHSNTNLTSSSGSSTPRLSLPLHSRLNTSNPRHADAEAAPNQHTSASQLTSCLSD